MQRRASSPSRWVPFSAPFAFCRIGLFGTGKPRSLFDPAERGSESLEKTTTADPVGEQVGVSLSERQPPASSGERSFAVNKSPTIFSLICRISPDLRAASTFSGRHQFEKPLAQSLHPDG